MTDQAADEYVMSILTLYSAEIYLSNLRDKVRKLNQNRRQAMNDDFDNLTGLA
jgi:hypothetical protein